MKVSTLILAILALAFSACQASSPFDLPHDRDRIVGQAGETCDPENMPC